MNDSIQVRVDKGAFLEVGRVFKRVYRYGSKNVIFTLQNGTLRIEFYGGGAELKCDSQEQLVPQVTAKTFAEIIAAHRADRQTDGAMTLTFRPELGEFATPLAGGKEKFF